MTPKKLVITAAAAGLMMAGSAGTAFASPAESPAGSIAVAPAAFSAPADWNNNNNRHDNNHGRGWDGDRRKNADWDGHNWQWWHGWGISPDLCRIGGGHIDWKHRECDGGRFDNFKVRWWR